MEQSAFSFKNFTIILGLTLLTGIGMYAVAYQFNDGKITQKVIGAICLGMAFPSLLIGGMMRLVRPKLQRYFAITAGLCLTCGLALIFI